MKAALLLLALAQQPDQRGEVATREDRYQGQAASAPIPDKYHMRNEGGSDGAGLCVYCSVIMAGATQGVADLAKVKESALWKHAKSRPGGSYPEKLAKDLNAVYPYEQWGEKWQQYTGTDFGVLEKWSNEGRVVASTMNTGGLYNYQPIHHMINVIGFRSGGYAGVVDNNEPGVRRWMPAKEFERRAIDGGYAWFFIWDRLPAAVRSLTTWVIVGMCAATMVFILARLRWATRPVVAFIAIFVGLSGVGKAQCPPGVACPTPQRNYIAPGGVYVMYPQVQQPVARPAKDWADTYAEHVGKDGRRWLRARVNSATHGAGTVFFMPDAWDRPVEKPKPKGDEPVNYGIDVDKLADQPEGAFLTNDPDFDPNTRMFGTSLPGNHGGNVTWLAVGIVGTAALAFIFHRLALVRRVR